jgi:hypothetical protein
MRYLITIALIALMGFAHGQDTAVNGDRWQIWQSQEDGSIYIRFELKDTVQGRHVDNDIYPAIKDGGRYPTTLGIAFIRTKEEVKPIRWSEWFLLTRKAKIDSEKAAERRELEEKLKLGLAVGPNPYATKKSPQ